MTDQLAPLFTRRSTWRDLHQLDADAVPIRQKQPIHRTVRHGNMQPRLFQRGAPEIDQPLLDRP
jgi:hypothetical protein